MVFNVNVIKSTSYVRIITKSTCGPHYRVYTLAPQFLFHYQVSFLVPLTSPPTCFIPSVGDNEEESDPDQIEEMQRIATRTQLKHRDIYLNK